MKDLNLVVKMVFGSHLYGTNTEDSDLDYKGVYLPTERDIILGRVKRTYNHKTGDGVSKNTKDDIDIEVLSICHFIKLACEGQTLALDMLHVPDEMIIEKSSIWDEIVANRHRFYTKNLQSFIDYSRNQAAKYGIKGSRLSSISAVIDELKKHDGDNRLRDIWDTLPRLEHIQDDLIDTQNGLRIYQVCGRSFHESVKIGYVLAVLERIYKEYGHRAIQAKNNENIDWKAVSHAVRAALQVKELLLYNNITFPLIEADYVLNIKKGELDYTKEVAPYLEGLIEEVDSLSKKSSLPEEADFDFWDDFIVKVIKEHVL